MKIRKGFVSNSSSSSFMVSALDSKIELKLTIDLSDYARYGYVLKNHQDVNQYLSDNFCDDDVNELRTQMIAAIDRGETIYQGSFGDDNGGIEAMLCELGIGRFIKDRIDTHVFWGDGGY